MKLPCFKKYLLIALISGTWLTACQDEGHVDVSKHDLSISEVKLALTNSVSTNNLITRIDVGQQYCTLSLEVGESILVQTKWIKGIDYDSMHWLVTFRFQDNQTQSANFLGDLVIGDEGIVVNPFLTSPLTALTQIKTPVKGKFRVAVRGKPGGVTIGNDFNHFGTDHELPILGLYENYANQVEFVFMDLNNRVRCSKLLTIPIGAIQDKPALEVDITRSQLSELDKGIFVVSDLRLGFDVMGELRWYYRGEGTSFFIKLNNGNFIASESGNRNFFEVTMLGQAVRKFNVPFGLHHEIIEMPNGNFLVASHSPPGAPYEDVVREIDRSNGTSTNSWDFNALLDPLRKTLPDTQPGDWLHINALYYDNTDNSIVISGRSQSAVVKIDYATGAIKWILGDHHDWGTPYNSFLLKPVNSQGNEINVEGTDFWNYGQHCVRRLSNGNVMMYDNGDFRGFYSNQNVPQASYTRIIEYKIDESKRTVELVWKFDNDKSIFTKYTGFAQELQGTRLAAYMWAGSGTPKVTEIDANNQVIFEATINPGMASYYRTMKVDLYEGIN